MSDNLVLQVNIALEKSEDRFPVLDNLLKDSIMSAKTYAEKVGADYQQHNGPRLYPEYSVCMEKFCVYDIKFSNYKKIFLLDTDTIIQNICPNIFLYERFSARPEPESRLKKKILKNLLIENLEHNYFNSGVVLFTKEFLNQTRNNLKKFSQYKAQYDEHNLDFYDQRILNRIVSEHYNEYNELGNSWNCVPHYNGIHYITHYMHPWKTTYKGNNNV